MKIKRFFITSALGVGLLFASCSNLGDIRSMRSSDGCYRAPKLSNGLCKYLLTSFFLIGKSLSSKIDHCKKIGNNTITVHDSYHDHNRMMLSSHDYISSLGQSLISKNTLESNDCFRKFNRRIFKRLWYNPHNMVNKKDKEALIQECMNNEFSNESLEECTEYAQCFSSNPVFQHLRRVITVEISGEINFSIVISYGDDLRYDLNSLIKQKENLSFTDIISIQEIIECYTNFIKNHLIGNREPDEYYRDHNRNGIYRILLKSECHKKPLSFINGTCSKDITELLKTLKLAKQNNKIST